MGRIVRRFARFHQVEVTNQLYQRRTINAAIAEDIHGLRVRNAVNGVVQTGFNYGLHLEQEILGVAGNITTGWEGIRLEMYSESAVAVAGTIYGMFMTNFIPAATVTGTQYVGIRISENGGSTMLAGLYFSTGGGSDMTNLLFLAGANTAWNPAVIPPGAQVGRIGVMCGGVQLYIPLWN